MPPTTYVRGIYNDRYTYETGSGGTFTINAGQLFALGNVLEGADQIVHDELMTAMGRSVVDLEQAVIDLMPRGTTGKLRQSTRKLIRQEGRSITGEVRSLGSIAPHNVFVDLGHGPIRPRRKKWLHYFVGGLGGREVFSKYSPPQPPRHFMKGGLERSTPRIEKALDDATGRIIFRLARP